jgi:hypothetical protein
VTTLDINSKKKKKKKQRRKHNRKEEENKEQNMHYLCIKQAFKVVKF